MSWLTPDTRSLETQASRNRIWIEWAKGVISGAIAASGFWVALINIYSRLVG